MHIRQAISDAKHIEAQTPHLRHFLESKVDKLHHCIELPEHEPAEALYGFVLRYIEHVPEFIDALSELSKEAGIQAQVQGFIKLAEGYFSRPPEIVDTSMGMKALIDQAYLAHRLVEEINDRILIACGVPLTPMDMTISNIVIHELLGDEYANKLDFAVLYTTESLFLSADFLEDKRFIAYLNQRKEKGWSADIATWPCLAGDSAISLKMTHTDSNQALH